MVRTFQSYFSICLLFCLLGFPNCKIADLNNAADPFTASFSLSRWINDALKPPSTTPVAETAQSSPTTEPVTATSTTTSTTAAFVPKVLCEDRGSWLFSYPPSGRVGFISIPRMVEDRNGNTYLLTMGNQNPGNATNFSTGVNQPVLIKLNSKGIVEWSYFLGETSTSENSIGNLILTDNGVLVVATVTNSIIEANSTSTFSGTTGTRNVGVFEISSSGSFLRGRYVGNANADFRAVDLLKNGSKEYLILARNGDTSFPPTNAGTVKSAPAVNSAQVASYIISLTPTLTANWYTVFSGNESQTPYILLQSPINENIWIFGIGRGDPDTNYNNADSAHPGVAGDRHIFLAGFSSSGTYTRHRYLGQNGVNINDSNPVYRASRIGDTAIVGAMHTGTYVTSPASVRAYVGAGREHTSFAFSLTNGSVSFNTFHGREQNGYLAGMVSSGLARSIVSMTKEIDPSVGVTYPGGRVEYVTQIDLSGSVSKHSFLSIGSTSYNFSMVAACDGSLTYGEVDYDNLTSPTAFQTKIQKLSRAAYPIPRAYVLENGSLEYRED